MPPTPVYDDALTRESAKRLDHLVRGLPHPIALAGGHAVRYRVIDAWKRRFNQEYFGSRDIDVIYYVDPAWTRDQLAESAFGQAPSRLKVAGYKPHATFNFSAIVDNQGHSLDTEPKWPKMLGVDFHLLFVDPMVTHAHDLAKDVVGFVPIDEPILGEVFRDQTKRDELKPLGPNVYLPTADLLVAAKLKSLPDRTKDDKQVKDLCDLYALAAFGGATTRGIAETVHRLIPGAGALVNGATNHEKLGEAARHLDVQVNDFRAVIGPLAVKP